MNLYEYQAKDLFKDAGIPIQSAMLVDSVQGALAVVDTVGLPCVLKAQVLRGGRGKAGLVQLADAPDEVERKAAEILGSRYNVQQLLVAEAVEIEDEFYLSLTLEPRSATVTVMVSSAGGVDIEETAATTPELIHREQINVFHGIMPFNLRNIAGALGVSKDTGRQVSRIVTQAFTLFRRCDALMIEVNPMAVCPDGRAIAIDGKVTIDDSALYRQPFEHTVEEYDDSVEYEAAREGIPYVKLDGDIGIMCAGAGLTNTVLDLIHDSGGTPANFLEFGGPNYRRAKEAMALALKSDAKVLLIVTFGTIARADVMAEGVTAAIRELKPTIPIVTAIRGTNEQRAAEILTAAGLDPISDTEEAVQRAVAIAKGADR